MRLAELGWIALTRIGGHWGKETLLSFMLVIIRQHVLKDENFSLAAMWRSAALAAILIEFTISGLPFTETSWNK